jgi:hypothetical protein
MNDQREMEAAQLQLFGKLLEEDNVEISGKSIADFLAEKWPDLFEVAFDCDLCRTPPPSE